MILWCHSWHRFQASYVLQHFVKWVIHGQCASTNEKAKGFKKYTNIFDFITKNYMSVETFEPG